MRSPGREGARVRTGSRTVNVEPSPGLLRTWMPPPIISTKRFEIASPRPVPPYFRVVDASACMNGRKSLVTVSSSMPTPVSAIAKTSSSRSSMRRRATAICTSPSLVNLQAFAIRLKSTWRSLVASAQVRPSPLPTTRNRLRFRPASATAVSPSSATSASTSTSSHERSILPASIFDRSRMSSIKPSRCFPARWIFSRSSVVLCAPLSSASSINISA